MLNNTISQIASLESLAQVIKDSFSTPQVFFKHSTRCSISSMAESRLNRDIEKSGTSLKIHQILVVENRDVSNEMEAILSVPHESPQLIVVSQGKSIYDASHNSIRLSDFKDLLGI